VTTSALLQYLFYIAVLIALAKPLGSYMARVYEGEPVCLRRLLGPLERLGYRLAGIEENAEMSWQRYAASMLAFNFAGVLVV
jgi:K+-transporting ATPase ATPase A chain